MNDNNDAELALRARKFQAAAGDLDCVMRDCTNHQMFLYLLTVRDKLDDTMDRLNDIAWQK